jgi:hypothetical protein
VRLNITSTYAQKWRALHLGVLVSLEISGQELETKKGFELDPCNSNAISNTQITKNYHDYRIP